MWISPGQSWVRPGLARVSADQCGTAWISSGQPRSASVSPSHNWVRTGSSRISVGQCGPSRVSVGSPRSDLGQTRVSACERRATRASAGQPRSAQIILRHCGGTRISMVSTWARLGLIWISRDFLDHRGSDGVSLDHTCVRQGRHGKMEGLRLLSPPSMNLKQNGFC